MTLDKGKSSAFQPPYQPADTFESVDSTETDAPKPEGAAYAAGREMRERRERVLMKNIAKPK